MNTLIRTKHIEQIYGLAKAVDGLMPEWKFLQVTDKVDVKNRVPPKSTTVSGGGN